MTKQRTPAQELVVAVGEAAAQLTLTAIDAELRRERAAYAHYRKNKIHRRMWRFVRQRWRKETVP